MGVTEDTVKMLERELAAERQLHEQAEFEVSELAHQVDVLKRQVAELSAGAEYERAVCDQLTALRTWAHQLVSDLVAVVNSLYDMQAMPSPEFDERIAEPALRRAEVFLRRTQ